MQPTSENTSIITAILIAFILVAFIALVIMYANNKTNEYYDHEMLKSQLETEEWTKKRIAQEIHDNIGQRLSLVSLCLKSIETSLKEPDEAKLTLSNNILSEAMNDLRDLSRTLNPQQMVLHGFIPTIEQHVAQLTATGKYDANLSVEGSSKDIGTKNEIFLYRILQEAIQNIIRHANASVIDIFLFYEKSTVRLSIKDNGAGFDAERVNLPGNAIGRIGGLQNMASRSIEAGAEFTITSSPGFGTQVSIALSINNNRIDI